MKINKLNILILLLFVCQVLASEELISKIENLSQNQQPDSLKSKYLRSLQNFPPWNRPRPVPKPKPELKGTEKVQTFIENVKLEQVNESFVIDQEDIVNADEIAIYGFTRQQNPFSVDFSTKNFYTLEGVMSNSTTQNFIHCHLDDNNQFYWLSLPKRAYEGVQQHDWIFFYHAYDFKTSKFSLQLHYKDGRESFVTDYNNFYQGMVNDVDEPVNFQKFSKYNLSFGDSNQPLILDQILQNVRICHGDGCFRDTKEGALLLMGEYPEDIIVD